MRFIYVRARMCISFQKVLTSDEHCKEYASDQDFFARRFDGTYGSNRTTLHKNERPGSGGIGGFVRTSILEQNSCVTDMSMEDVIWVNLKTGSLGISLQYVYTTSQMKRAHQGGVTVKHFTC